MDCIKQTVRALCCWGTPESPPASPPLSPVLIGAAQAAPSVAASREDARRRRLEDRLSGRLSQAVTSTSAGDVPSAGELASGHAGPGDLAWLHPPVIAEPSAQAMDAAEPGSDSTLRPPHSSERTPLLRVAGRLQRDVYGATALGSTSIRFPLSSSSSNDMLSSFPGLRSMEITTPDYMKAPPGAPAPGRIGRPKTDPDDEDSVPRSTGPGNASHAHNEPSSESSELAWINASINVPSDRSSAQSDRQVIKPAATRAAASTAASTAATAAATTAATTLRGLPYMHLLGDDESSAFTLQPRAERFYPPQVNLNAAEAEAAAVTASIPPAFLRRQSSDEESSGSSSK